MHDLSAEDILRAYCIGIFPMADDASDDGFFWYEPEMRGQLPIDTLHVPQRLQRKVKQFPFDVRVDTAFADVIKQCAEVTPDRPKTWINKAIADYFIELYEHGFAHSVECWDRDNGTLIGGLYGLAIGSAFFGESMFSRATDASKIALIHLVARLKYGGFTLLDTQFINDHLQQFGAYEIAKEDYLKRLQDAIRKPATFFPTSLAELYSSGSSGATTLSSSPSPSGASSPSDSSLSESALVSSFLQSITQTS